MPPSTVQLSQMSFVMLPREWCSPLHYLMPFILALSHSYSQQEKRLQHVGYVSMPGSLSALESCLWAESPWYQQWCRACIPWAPGKCPPTMVTQKSRKESSFHLYQTHLLKIFGPYHAYLRNSPNSESLMGPDGYSSGVNMDIQVAISLLVDPYQRQQ